MCMTTDNGVQYTAIFASDYQLLAYYNLVFITRFRLIMIIIFWSIHLETVSAGLVFIAREALHTLQPCPMKGNAKIQLNLDEASDRVKRDTPAGDSQ